MKILAIRHVEIEGLCAFEGILKTLGIEWTYLDTPKGERLTQPLEEYMALFVLGGYMGAYEEDKYDFLAYEFKLMEAALKKNIPVLGICLGAQMLAKVLGAKVYPGERGKEIGWMEVIKTGNHPYFSDFPKRLKVFQWHGDTFDLPSGAERVFSSEKYENQGFVYGKSVGLQFHLEVDRENAFIWKEVYKEEILEEGISPEAFSDFSDSEEGILKELRLKFLKKFLEV